jgi:hypothetical protein
VISAPQHVNGMERGWRLWFRANARA